MRTPSTVVIGALRYKVHTLRLLPEPYRRDAGVIKFKERFIFLTTHSHRGRRWTAYQRRLVFWHEIVHGILHDMRRWKLNGDEKFVHGFARRLEKVVRQVK